MVGKRTGLQGATGRVGEVEGRGQVGRSGGGREVLPGGADH
jgi:hypothetical protein